MLIHIGLITDSSQLQSLFEFSVDISNNYFNNPYHSFYHAIDVSYMVYYLIEDLNMGEQLDLTLSEKAGILISALGHDVLHPGTNNIYQVYLLSVCLTLGKLLIYV